MRLYAAANRPGLSAEVEAAAVFLYPGACSRGCLSQHLMHRPHCMQLACGATGTASGRRWGVTTATQASSGTSAPAQSSEKPCRSIGLLLARTGGLRGCMCITCAAVQLWPGAGVAHFKGGKSRKGGWGGAGVPACTVAS